MATNKEKIYEYLRKNMYMTLATASPDGKPEAATVEYVLDGYDLLVNTYTYYRKYENLLKNPRVACVVTTNHDVTVQFDGTADILEGEQAEAAKKKMLEKQPEFADFFNDADTRFMRIQPYWMRMRDYTQDPEEITLYEGAQQ